MAEFQYRAITPEGKEKKGTIEGRNEQQVINVLKSQKYVILSISEAGIMNRSLNFQIGGRPKTRDYCIFCRQIVSILGAGVSVISALDMMAEQTENPYLKVAIKDVHEGVSKGETLAGAMRRQKKIFPSMLVNMVEAGEASGSLENAFSRMAIQFEKENQLTAAVKKAMMYPIVLIIVMIGLLVLMMAWVIPSFMKMFEELDTEMPAITQFILDMSNGFRAYWWLLGLIAIGLAVGLRYYSNTKNGKFVIGGLKLKIPVFGKIQRKQACARLGRTLSTLLSAGVPMIEALQIAGRSMDNVHYKKALMDAAEQVSRGSELSRPLAVSGLFPPMVVHMVSIGEDTGNIEAMLENIADYYEEDVQMATEQMMALMEPMIIVVMAVVVGFLILAILQPMLSLYDALG